MATNRNIEVVAEVEIPASSRTGRDIFAFNAGLRELKKKYLASPHARGSQTLVLRLIARD